MPLSRRMERMVISSLSIRRVCDNTRRRLGSYAARPGVARIVANAGWLTGDRLWRMTLGFVVNAWIARYLGPTKFGLFAFACSFADVFSSFAGLGIEMVLVRNIVRDPSTAQDLMGTAWALRFIAGVVGAASMVAAVAYLEPGDSEALTVAAIVSGVVVLTSFGVIESWFSSQTRSKFPVIANNIVLTLVGIGRVASILVGAGVKTFASLFLMEAGLRAVGLVATYRLTGGSLGRWRVRWAIAAELLRGGYPFLLVGCATAVYMRSDLIIIQRLMGESHVGIYSAAVRLAEVWYFVPSAIITSVTPAIYRLKESGNPRYAERFQAVLQLMAIIAIGLAIPMTILATPLVTLLYGAPYAEAGPVLSLYIWTAVFAFIGWAEVPWMMAEGFVMLLARNTILGAIVNVALNFLLIPHFGLLGSAGATLVSQAIAAFLANGLDRRTWPMLQMQAKALTLRGTMALLRS
jgi:polysaccharide transporter, PST family